MVEQSLEPHKGILGLLRRHPVLVAIFVICTGIGIACGAAFLPAEWTLARRVAGGAFAGIGVAVFLTVTRLFD